MSHPNIKGAFYLLAVLVPTLLSPDLVPFVPAVAVPYLKAAMALLVMLKGYMDPTVFLSKLDKEIEGEGDA